MIDLTLGIPLYRSAAFLPELFAHLRALHALPREIVFLDDASPDDSARLVKQFIAEIGSRTETRLITHPRNLGIAAAYNCLAAEAHQPWVQILDSDDYPVEADYYDRVGEVLAGTGANVVVTALRGDAGVFKLTRGFEHLVPRRPPDWWPLLGSFATRSGIIYRREALRNQPFADPAFPGSDVVHLLALRRGRRARFVAAAHVYYRVHAAATSGQLRDYSRYLASLAPFDATTRLTHRLDLSLRRLGQWWTR